MGGKPGNPEWQKGRSGNPRGRPKVDLLIKDYAKAHTELAINTLVEICKGKKFHASSRVAAAEALLNRAYGKPAQAIIGGGEDDPPIALTEIVIRAVDAATKADDETGNTATPESG